MSDGTKDRNKATVSRRDFITKSAVGAGAAAAFGAAAAPAAAADAAPSMPAIRIADEFTKSYNERQSRSSSAKKGSAALKCSRALQERGTGRAVLLSRQLHRHQLHLRCRHPGVRRAYRNIMCAAADGFSRVTGEVAATSGTEGPGFTNMIMSIASADRAHSPVLVLASNMAMSNEDRMGGIQQMYQQPTTEGSRSTASASRSRIAFTNTRRTRSGSSERRAGPGAPRFPIRSVRRPLQRCVRAQRLLRQEPLSDRVCGESGAERRRHRG